MRKGVHLSKEHKRKISEAMKGRCLSNEHRGKLSEYHKGKPLSEEHRKRMRKPKRRLQFKIRKMPPRSEEHKQRLSDSLMGRKLSDKHRKNLSKTFSEEHKQKLSESHIGIKHSEETRRKMSKAKKGEKSHLWKGGITEKNRLIRTQIEYSLWRESVFARDNWTCQECGQKGGKLNAHHIKPFAKYPELRTSIENGITLCKKCHKEIHKRRVKPCKN